MDCIFPLLASLAAAPTKHQLVVMPVDRLVFGETFDIGRFRFLPPGVLDVRLLRPVPNKRLEVGSYEGQELREVQTSATGFEVEVMQSSPLVAFTTSIDWEAFLEGNHDTDIDLLTTLSAEADRAMDVIRYEYCRLDLPDTLPAPIGTWSNSGAFLGALLYTMADHESYLIAGSALDAAIVRGLGLEMSNRSTYSPMLEPKPGFVSSVAAHGLTLMSDAMRSADATAKFMRVISTLEFLANPDGMKPWAKNKGNIICHCAKNEAEYRQLSHRFRELTGHMVDGTECGIRTLLVHHGKRLEAILPTRKERADLFRELERYVGVVLSDMIKYEAMTWREFSQLRTHLKSQFSA